MKLPNRRQFLTTAMLGLSGCATLAKIPDSPARHLAGPCLQESEAGSRYFITVFGAQNLLCFPYRTHSFATAMKATCVDDALVVEESHTISWLPKTLVIRPFALQPEPGINLNLHDTLQLMLSTGHRLSQWGAYECRPALFRRFVAQKQFLESGAIGYQVFDMFGEAGRLGNGCLCLHALIDMDPNFQRDQFPFLRFGNHASRWFVKQMWDNDALISPENTYDCLDEQLAIKPFPIAKKSYLSG